MTVPVRYRSPLVSLALLAMGLTWLCISRDARPSWSVALGLILLTAVGAAALLAYRRRRADCNDQTMSADAAGELPVILVAGPYAAAAFERGARRSTLRRTGDAVWMLVRTPEELAASIATLEDTHQRLPDAVLIPVLADGDRDEAVIRQEFSRWRYQLDQTARYRAGALPCYIALYACLGTNGDATADTIWFGDAMDFSTTRVESQHARQAVSRIRRQLDHAWSEIAQPSLATRAALGHAVFDWLDDVALLSILSSLANTAPLSLRGLLLSDIGYSPVHAGAWTRWLTGKTGLRPCPMPPQTQPLSLPGIIARPPVRWATKSERRRQHWLASHAVAAPAALAVALLGVSVWMNSGRLMLVASDPGAVIRSSSSLPDAQRERFEALRGQHAELVREAQDPPKGVTIDNLSLFDSGKTALKPGAESKLKAALDLILANPGKRILIAGHTDDVGTSAANLLLSEARARAIRDWLIATASLPVTRFAIQGYGDTRPAASNEDNWGRAVNRRVEITLLPDPRAN